MKKRTRRKLTDRLVDNLVFALLGGETDADDTDPAVEPPHPTLLMLFDNLAAQFRKDLVNTVERMPDRIAHAVSGEVSQNMQNAVLGAFARSPMTAELQGLRLELVTARGQKAQVETTEAEVGVMLARIRDLEASVKIMEQRVQGAHKREADSDEQVAEQAALLHRHLFTVAQRAGLVSSAAACFLPGKKPLDPYTALNPSPASDRDKAIVTDLPRMVKLIDARLVELLAREKKWLETPPPVAGDTEEAVS